MEFLLLIPWIQEARKHIGTKEYSSGNNPKILKWADLVGKPISNDYSADSIPWCGLFVAYVFSQIGVIPVDQPLWAKSWTSFGFGLSEPAFGCVTVFSRNGGGHVGFYLGENASYYFILGGNQSDMVSIKQIAKNRAIAFRWPKGMEKFLKKGRVKTNISGASVSVKEA